MRALKVRVETLEPYYNAVMLTRTVGLKVNKLLIKRKLALVTAALPTASPSRTTLNAVNSFLMERR